MHTLHPSSRLKAILLGAGLALVSGCGTNGPVTEAGVGDSPPPDDGGETVSICGLRQATALTGPGPAVGIWQGSMYVWAGTILLGIARMTGAIDAEGTSFFQVNHDELWAGTVFASETGEIQTNLTRYQRLEEGGIGGTVANRSWGQLVFGQATAQTSLAGRYSALGGCDDFTLAFDENYLRPASLVSVAGVYSATEASGYALTVTVHSDGQLDGSDTNGCVLFGNVTVPDADRNHYRAEADVSSCHSLDGHFEGLMFLREFAEPGDDLSMVMSLSNSQNAIFYQLTR